MRSINRASLTIVQMNDTHAYFDVHWEFAYGPKVFAQRVAELNYPMLAINVFDKVTKKPVYQTYIIKEIGGLRIGIIGIASIIVDKTMPPSFSEGIYFTLVKMNFHQLLICCAIKKRLT